MIPILELLGNLLLSILMDPVKTSLSKSSDYHLSTLPEFQTFDENQVQEIIKLTDSKYWYYCNTKSNPADLWARVRNYSDFQSCNLRWACRNFLREKTLNNHDVSSNFEPEFDELKSIVCLQRNCKYVFD